MLEQKTVVLEQYSLVELKALAFEQTEILIRTEQNLRVLREEIARRELVTLEDSKKSVDKKE